MARASIVLSFLLTSTLIMFAGCSKGGRNTPTGTVSGTVTMNGKPLGDATVTFFGENDGDTALGTLQSDGTYTLKYGAGFSIPVGDYRVAIVTGPPAGSAGPDPSDLMKSMTPAGAGKSLIPEKYRDPKTSGLIAVVAEGANANINFDLK